MSSRKKTKPWQSYFNPQQQELVILIASHKSRSGFLWGLVFGFILCAAVSSYMAYTMSDNYMKINEANIVNEAVHDKLTNLNTQMDDMRSRIAPKPEDYN